MQIDEERFFEDCFRGHAASVHTYALRRAGAEAAQDVTAETFLIAWRQRERMPAEPLPWLYAIARGVLANEQRAANRRVALAARIAAESRRPGGAGGGDRRVLEALAGLREHDREALLLRCWEGLSSSEAAHALGCSSATLAVRLHRARRRLARLLDDIDAQDDPICAHLTLPEASS